MHSNGRRRAAAAIAGICVVVTACGDTVSAAESAGPTRTMIPRPLVERELGSLLLSPEEAAAAMGVPAMTVTESQTAMSDHSAIMEPVECLAIDGAAELQVYADSGFRAERDESLNDADAEGSWRNYVKQSVVLFPYLEKAGEFFDASVEQWPACHEYTHTQSGSRWRVGQLTADDRTLTTVAMQQDAAAPGWGCGRALIHRNNVIIDVNTCSPDPGDSARRIAEQIAVKVDAQW